MKLFLAWTVTIMAGSILSNIGYALHLPGLGISEPAGTPYNAGRSPSAVYGGQVPQNFIAPVPTNYVLNPGPAATQAGNYGVPSSQPGGQGVVPAKSVLGASTQATTAPTGGGGGSHINPATGLWDDNYYAQQQQQNLPDVYGQVDNAYGDVMNQLDSMYGNEMAGKQDFLNSFTGQFDAQRPLLDQSYQQGLATNQQQVNQTQQQNLSAIDAARSLYNELSQGARQRFGNQGAGSTGDFANAFLGRQFQQNVGQIQGTTGQNMQKLMDQHTQIQGQYQAQLQSLEAQKQAALSQAQDAFRQRLDAIDNARLQANENKAQLKLQALQDLRSNAQAILNQANQFQQSLQAQLQAANLNLRNSILGYQAAAGQNIDLNQYTNPQYSTIGGGTSSPQLATNITGQYDPRRLQQQ